MDFIATNTVYQTPLYLEHPKLFKKNIYFVKSGY